MKKECYPLDLTNKIADKYENCWKIVEDFRTDSSLPKWDERCYLPIAAGIAIASNGSMSPFVRNMIGIDGAIITAVAAWRLHKQIYAFDPTMEKTLIDQADDDLKIPMDILNKIPDYCIYIETTMIEDFQGFFVHFESDVNTSELELRFLLAKEKEGLMPLPLHLIPGGTIRDCMNATFQSIFEQSEDWVLDYDWDEPQRYALELCCKLMQLVLYICSKNKEMEEDPIQKNITRQPKSIHFIKDKYREVQRWILGEKSGDMMRKLYTSNEHEEDQKLKTKKIKAGTPKRPHFRKAHWHHYWVGSEAKGDRMLELKWIVPMFIHKSHL